MQRGGAAAATFDVFRHGALAFLTMELLSGETLAELLSRVLEDVGSQGEWPSHPELRGDRIPAAGHRTGHVRRVVFEIDRPGPQAWKRRRLVEPGGELAGGRVPRPVPFCLKYWKNSPVGSSTSRLTFLPLAITFPNLAPAGRRRPRHLRRSARRDQRHRPARPHDVPAAEQPFGPVDDADPEKGALIASSDS